mgnify:CR=1 FL=1
MEWTLPRMNKVSEWGSNFLHVGILGLCLSIVLSEYTSQFLYAHYQTWPGWRTIIGSDPNSLTSIIQKITWPIFFFATWFMLWKLDSFFQRPSSVSDKSIKDRKKEEEEQNDSTAKPDSRKKKDCEHDQVLIETQEEIPDSSPNSHEEPEEIIFLPEDYEFARVLGLEKPVDLKVIKSTYRKIIAQYHPDRVAAMGPEIKEIAEKKAKEINEAYEHLRKKFDLS